MAYKPFYKPYVTMAKMKEIILNMLEIPYQDYLVEIKV
jgi:hypothetical protein